MKLHYYPEAHGNFVEFGAGSGVGTREFSNGLNVDHASRRLDLSTLKTEALPLRSTRVG